MPIQISPRIWVFELGTPPPNLGPGSLALPEIPSRAFGDGSHPTTRLCAGAVDHLCRQNRAKAVLDVGTGTGILARIARLRSVPFVVGTDIDPIALEAARANTALDVQAGELQISADPPEAWGARFDLVVANILERPLRELSRALSQALAADGTLLLSGFTPLQVPALEVAFGQEGLHVRSTSSLEGWCLLGLRRM